MKILITGSHGLVGAALIKSLSANGHQIVRLVRSAARSVGTGISWDPEKGTIDLASLEGFDAVIHLAGESIAESRWTEEKKRRIRESRVDGTRLLSESLAKLSQPPKVLVCASAIGFYGDRGAEVLTEASAPGNDFLAGVCVEWEGAAEPAARKGIRVVNFRIGIILSGEGGALGKMLTPFRMGVGGKIGNGRQYMSWVALDDVIAAIELALVNDTLGGPVNLVAPEPVTNAEFTKTLGKALSRPTLFPVPQFGVRLAFGEMADALLLSSQRVEPVRLKEAGYQFQYPELEGALTHVLEKSRI